jgi:hypothetical protein
MSSRIKRQKTVLNHAATDVYGKFIIQGASEGGGASVVSSSFLAATASSVAGKTGTYRVQFESGLGLGQIFDARAQLWNTGSQAFGPSLCLSGSGTGGGTAPYTGPWVDFEARLPSGSSTTGTGAAFGVQNVLANPGNMVTASVCITFQNSGAPGGSGV